MSFRKRNIGLSGPSLQNPNVGPGTSSALSPGVRPSPLDGRLTTSTGTSSLDDLLGHSGFALGNALLIEENGTTEFATTLLRYFAAEGIIQGHKLHIVGVGEQWARELPAMSATAGGSATQLHGVGGEEKERMKIAWRYERLGEFGAGPPSVRVPSTVHRSQQHVSSGEQRSAMTTAFCHTFDLTKRLPIPEPRNINFIPIRLTSELESPFSSVLHSLRGQLTSSSKSTIHRLIIPNLLSPVMYPPHANSPQLLLQFLHSLRALLRQYTSQLVIFISLPLMLYPRSTGLTRWIELLCDGVVELSPFPHSMDAGLPATTSGAATTNEEKPQGMVKVHRLPVFSEKGGCSSPSDDLAFTVSRRKFVIKPFNLPPVEGDTEAQLGQGEGKPTKVDIDF